MNRMDPPKPHRESYPALDAVEVNDKRSGYKHFACFWRDETGARAGNTAFTTVPKGVTILHSIEPGTHLVPGRHKTLLLMRSLPSGVGGKRAWFVCPACKDSVSKLYYRGEAWKCHSCSNLVYASQRMRKRSRLTKKQEWLSNFVGRGRPKGMHQKTYERHVRELHDLTSDVKALGGQLSPNVIVSRKINLEWLLEDEFRV
jgi:hypothetical protein